jgi:prepilin-type N-terminal cleavage/methylation domain-containing protein
MLNAVPPFRSPHRSQAGFSLPELLIAVTILLIISSAVTSGLLQMTNSQRTIWNRTQLHAGVRSATELLQQEVGQSGRVALPGTVTISADVAMGANTATLTVVAVPAVTDLRKIIFPGERLIIQPGGNEETVEVSNVTATEITISRSVDARDTTIQLFFVNAHPAGAVVTVLGGFATGIVPPGFLNGSTATTLKLYGDINGDGNMVYIEYTCDPAPAPPALPAVVPPGTGNLYRNVIPFDQTTAKLAATTSQVLLSNIQANPGGTACFTYMPNPQPIVGADTFVLDVAITLTVQTQTIDPITKQFQLETKALLNVSPRNVFNVWQLASAGVANRVQPMPPTVTNLLP